MPERQIDDIQGFSERLRRAMKQANETISTLVYRGVLPKSKAYDIAYGRSQPNLLTLDRICRGLNVSADYLLGLDGPIDRAAQTDSAEQPSVEG